MPNNALVAISGGVDSAVAASMTLRDGFDCAGAVMMLNRDGYASLEDARSVAKLLSIPFHVLDFTEIFAEQVIEPFIATYRLGRTPNPCITCNKQLKFGSFLDKASELMMDHIVTGHYAQIEHNAQERYLLKKGSDLSKDQSYFLYTLTQDQLARIRFPIGGLTKSQVREIAFEVGFENARKKESQDICFIPDGDYVNFINQYTGVPARKGSFIDENGNKLGEHNGVLAYTVGQRRGLGLSTPQPSYVLELRPQDDTIVVGKEDMLYSKSLCAADINLIPFDKLDKPLRAQVKIRYAHTGQPATVHQIGEDTLRIDFDEPQRAITKGQAAVIYDGDIVIGGGTIV